MWQKSKREMVLIEPRRKRACHQSVQNVERRRLGGGVKKQGSELRSTAHAP
jgi:hypothetical protein